MNPLTVRVIKLKEEMTKRTEALKKTIGVPFMMERTRENKDARNLPI
jgi:hypothetical protein